MINTLLHQTLNTTDLKLEVENWLGWWHRSRLAQDPWAREETKATSRPANHSQAKCYRKQRCYKPYSILQFLKPSDTITARKKYNLYHICDNSFMQTLNVITYIPSMPVQYLMLKHHYELEVCFNDLNKPPLFHDLTRSFSIYIHTQSWRTFTTICPSQMLGKRWGWRNKDMIHN